MTGGFTVVGQAPVSGNGFDAVVRFLIDKPLAIAGILLGAFIVNKLARRVVKLLVRQLGRRRAHHGPGLVKRHTPASLLDTGEMLNTRTTQRFEALAVALAGMTSFVVWLSAALAILYVLGVRLGLLLTGAGLIGVALGFGAQSLIRDVLSRVFILIEDQFGVGDEVDLGVAIGSVEAVTLRATRSARSTAPSGMFRTGRSSAPATCPSTGRARCSTCRSHSIRTSTGRARR